MAAAEEWARGAVERLSEDEALRGDLSDQGFGPLLDWGVAAVQACAPRVTDAQAEKARNSARISQAKVVVAGLQEDIEHDAAMPAGPENEDAFGGAGLVSKRGHGGLQAQGDFPLGIIGFVNGAAEPSHWRLTIGDCRRRSPPRSPFVQSPTNLQPSTSNLQSKSADNNWRSVSSGIGPAGRTNGPLES